METEGSHELGGARIRMPLVLFHDDEYQNTIDDTEMAVPEVFSSSFGNGDTAPTAAAVFDAEVVEERDLQQEVQERMDKITIDATSVVNLSSKKEGKNNIDRSDSRRNITAIALLVTAAVIIVSGTIIGTRTLRRTPLATMVTSSPTASLSVLDYARNILSPLTGEEVFMNASSPQYNALWWMAHEDPANMMMKMMVGNVTESPSMVTSVTERYTMAVLYFSTDGPNWALQYDFLGKKSICDWGEPIECNEEGSAVRLDMGTSIFFYNISFPGCPIFTRTHTAKLTKMCFQIAFASLPIALREKLRTI
jgi:hypothetical protein